MEDIEFTLYHKESDRALMSDKTDKDGILDFGINFSESDYYLKEENLPDDYVDLGNIEFKLHRDSTEEDGKYQGMQMVNVENIQTEHEGKMCENFAVTVLDVDGEPDKNKKVKLVNKTTSKEYKETTNSDGKIVKPREDLPAGEYEVYEVIEVEGVEKHVRIGDITVKYVGEDDLQCNASVQPEVTTISGTKTWLDNDSEERPDSIGINVYRQIEGGVKEKIDTITVYENNNWEFSKKYRALDFDGNEYTYRIEEITPTGYESNVTGNFEDGFTITNTRTGKTEVSVTKVWKDNNNATGDRPNYIKVNLIRDNIV